MSQPQANSDMLDSAQRQWLADQLAPGGATPDEIAAWSIEWQRHIYWEMRADRMQGNGGGSVPAPTIEVIYQRAAEIRAQRIDELQERD